MKFDIFVNTTQKVARAALTGSDGPRVFPIYQTHLLLRVWFFAEGGVPALLTDSAAFVVAVKDETNPESAVLLQLTAPTATETDHYEFEWNYIDSVPLGTLIGQNPSVPTRLEIKWTISGQPERVSFPVSITNAWVRISDSAPDFTPFQVKVTAGGFGVMTLPDGTKYNWPLNTGDAPA